MTTRRDILRWSLAMGASLGLAGSWLLGAAARAGAKVRRLLLPASTIPTRLEGRNPANLDTRLLEITPIEKFQTMGSTKVALDPARWRLKVKGKVKRTLSLSLAQIKALPAVEHKVLLICPGVFSFHARWRGVPVSRLLAMAGVDPKAKRLIFTGSDGDPPNEDQEPSGKTSRFDLKKADSDRLLLAYQVNGRVLPRKHGFPLRLVAPDHYGYTWAKYLLQIEVA